MKQLQDWCGDNCDPLSIVCAIVVVVYIGLANPGNTPAFFGSVVFKLLIFAVVVVVTLMDTKIGVIFGFAMVLSVSYSYMRNISPAAMQESFAASEDELGSAEEDAGNLSIPEEEEGIDAENAANIAAENAANITDVVNTGGVVAEAANTDDDSFKGSFAPYHAM